MSVAILSRSKTLQVRISAIACLSTGLLCLAHVHLHVFRHRCPVTENRTERQLKTFLRMYLYKSKINTCTSSCLSSQVSCHRESTDKIDSERLPQWKIYLAFYTNHRKAVGPCCLTNLSIIQTNELVNRIQTGGKIFKNINFFWLLFIFVFSCMKLGFGQGLRRIIGVVKRKWGGWSVQVGRRDVIYCSASNYSCCPHCWP
jgi:hypothetical protein